MPTEVNQKVKVVMHLPGGYTKVLVESTVNSGLAGHDVHWDIPTEVIPAHLRHLGSRFMVYSKFVSGKKEAEQMTADEIRKTQKISVHEITDE